MSGNLPIIKHKLYKHKLTGLGKEIQYRPFINKEQKILLMANDEGGEENKFEAIGQIISNCTLGKVNPHDLAVFDVLDLFIRIREVSVEPTANLQLSVHDDETGRTEFIPVQVNLNEVQVHVPEGHTTEFMLDENYGVKMRYPTFAMSSKLSGETDTSLIERSIVLDCIEYVYSADGEIYDSFSREELETFYDSLDFMMNSKIENFFQTLPDIQCEVTVETEKGPLTKIIKGIDGFFPY